MKKKGLAVIFLFLVIFSLPAIAVNLHACVEMKTSKLSLSMHLACCKMQKGRMKKGCCHDKIHAVYQANHYLQANNAPVLKPVSFILHRSYFSPFFCSSQLSLINNSLKAANHSPPVKASYLQPLYCTFLI